MQTLENQIATSKKTYAGALKKLEVLNTEIHRRRASTMSQHHLRHLDSRKSFSTGNSPEPMRTRLDISKRGGSGSFVGGASLSGASDTESVSSLQLGDLKDQFSGSTGSLPSIGASSISISETSQSRTPTPTPEADFDEDNPVTMKCDNQETRVNHRPQPPEVVVDSEPINSVVESDCGTPTAGGRDEVDSDLMEMIANRLVQQTLTTVVAIVEKEQQNSTAKPVTLIPNS